MASDELAAKLNRRTEINDKLDAGEEPDVPPARQVFNPYTEFKEFTRKQIQELEKTFRKYDVNKDNHLCFDELKVMMEKLGAAQTHLALKEMIHEVDEDKDGMINLREFLLIFRKAMAGELEEDSGLLVIYDQLNEVDVSKEGVGKAAEFFASKIQQQERDLAVANEIVEEQAERKREAEEKKQRKEEFKNKAQLFEAK